MMDRKITTLIAVLLMGHASAAFARADSTHAEEKSVTVASPALKPAGRLAGEFEKTQTRRSTRVARKLGVGLLSGSVFSIAGRHKDFELGYKVGPAAGAMVGVMLVDPPSWSSNRRSSFLALAGSSVGALAGFMAVPDPLSREWHDRWPLLLPAIGATIASELWRDSSQVSRLPIARVPDAKAPGEIDTRITGVRIASKLGAGAGLGILSGLTAGGILLSTPGGEGFGAPVVFALGWAFGSIAGTAYGVSHLDPYDRFTMALFGSLLGSVVGIWASDFSGSGLSGVSPLFVCPAIGATITSELSRSPPEPRRLSIGLMPGPGALSMIATLHY